MLEMIVGTIEMIVGFIFEGVLIDLLDGVFWFAEKKKISKFVRLLIYTIALVPLIIGMGYLSITHYLNHDVIDTVMLSLITIITLILYAYALTIIFFRKQEQAL